MSRKLTYTVSAVSIIFLIAAAALFGMRQEKNAPPAGYVQGRGTLEIINGTTTRTISVLIAETPDETTRGLSGMPSLLHDEGMLFLFDRSQKFGFWMPDMHFAIDMIWIDESWRVIDVSAHATPESYPKTIFYPHTPATYVLEVNDNIAKEWGIATGTTMRFIR